MKAGLLLSLLLFTSCATFTGNMTRRQNAYLDCIKSLNENGLKQELIERFCDKTLDK
jgi:hypothetical protein